MGDTTDRFNFATLGPGDSMADGGYKYSDADIRLIDRLLEHALEHHVHTGEAAGDDTPLTGPALTLHSTGGSIAAGTRVHYRFTFVDSSGNETGASPLTFIDTPAAVDDPAAGSLAWASTGGGTLPPGSYTYVLTAYAGSTTLETRAGAPAQVRLNVTTSTNEITLTMPSLPPGADGWNVYRKKPGAPRYFFLANTTGTAYVDDGSDSDDTTRTLPTSNTTNNTNAVTVSLPGATPALPGDDYTWKLYRSYSAIDWNNSVLHHVVETESESGGAIVTTYDDVGEPTFLGAPPDATQIFGSPPRIEHTDAAHVTGNLPPGRNVVPQLVRFEFDDQVVAETGTKTWVCDFDRADVIWCRAFLGVNSSPASQDLIVDVNKYDSNAATPAWLTIYTTQANRPRIQVGYFIGDTTVPDVIHLLEGDALSVDVDQAGGGATPTDFNLVVAVFMYVQHGSTTASYQFIV